MIDFTFKFPFDFEGKEYEASGAAVHVPNDLQYHIELINQNLNEHSCSYTFHWNDKKQVLKFGSSGQALSPHIAIGLLKYLDDNHS